MENNIKSNNLEICKKIFSNGRDIDGDYIKLGSEDKLEISHYFLKTMFSDVASFWRMKMIESCIAVEKNLAQILSEYFTSGDVEKSVMLNLLVFDRMSVQTKVENIKKILKKYHSNIEKVYSNNFTNINALIAFRNKVAHSLSLNTEDISEYLVRIDKILSKREKLGKLEYFHISFYENYEFITEKILFSEIITKVEEMYKENDMLMNLKKEICQNSN